MRVLYVLAVFVSVFPALLQAGEKKPAPITIRLHGQGNEKEGSSFVTAVELTNPKKKIFIRQVPVVSERDIKAFYPFPARDGTAGSYFRLDAHGANKLQQFTIEDRGKLAVVMINGRVAAALRVDANVTDGILYVPNGILPNEVVRLEQKYPVIGRESDFGKKPAQLKKEKAAKEKKQAP